MSGREAANEGGYRVAIVGAGPAGFYLAEALLKSSARVRIDVFEKLPAPHGLVRYGVAPDHEKIKRVSKVFERILDDPRVRLRCGVQLGRDLSLAELRACYHQVALCLGCEKSRPLGIEGESASGVFPAADFVYWYNSHPDATTLPVELPGRSVAVVGAGDVALDVARMLLQSTEGLRSTDCAEHALEVLRESRVEVVHLIVRRGPAQVAFARKELAAIAALPGVEVQMSSLQLLEAAASFDEPGAQKRLECLQSVCADIADAPGIKALRLHFLRSPVRVLECDGRVTGVELRSNRLQPNGLLSGATGSVALLPVCAVIPAVGYQPVAVPGLAFHQGRLQNAEGRVLQNGEVQPGLFTAGWLKRGPSGVIGTNKPDAQETARSMLAERHEAPLSPCSGADSLLLERRVDWIDKRAWRALDEAERERGRFRGRPREKVLSLAEARQLLGDPGASACSSASGQ